MLSWIREKFGTVVIGGIIGFIAFVFVFYGVFNPKSTRGLHEGALAGTVNGEPITISEFNRSLNQRMAFFKNMGGGGFTEEQLKQFRIREGVFQELVRRKLMMQEAYKQGVLAADEAVLEKIREIPAFQKDGKFDLPTYKQVLEANSHTPASFEHLVREDISLQAWEGYFRSRVHVADNEIKGEFLVANDKRDLKYVLLTTETGKKGIVTSPADIQKYLADTAKMNLVKSQFEARKAQEYKGQTLDAVKDKIAAEMIAGEKTAEIQKLNDKLAEQIQGILTADKGSDAKVNELLKPYGVTVKQSGPVSRENPNIPGVGEATEVVKDLFAKKSPINPADGGKAKKYAQGGWTLVGVVTGVTHPDLAKLDESREDLLKKMTSRKERELFEAWLKKLNDKAKIDPNPSVVSGQS